MKNLQIVKQEIEKEESYCENYPKYLKFQVYLKERSKTDAEMILHLKKLKDYDTSVNLICVD